MPDIFPESRDEAILLSMINGEEYTGFPESRIEVLLLQLKATLEDWKSKTKGAYVFHGSVEFSELPSTLTEDMVGWTYNMLEEFTTDNRFVDGAGKVYPAGTNVVIANVGTDETPVLKFDVTSAFVDVNAIYSAIDNIADMIADEFDEDEAYAVGDIVWYVDDLYTFVSPHTAGDPWSNLEVNMTTVDEIINAVYADINNTISDIEDMIANQFNAATAYSEDDYVIYQNRLYKFTSDHEAGAAWDPSIVSSIDVMTAIKQAESDLATLSEYFAAMTNIVSDLEDQVDTIQDVLAEALTKTASGNPVVITDCAGGKARSLITSIEPIQDLHGYDKPWAGGAGKNKLEYPYVTASSTINGVTFTVNSDGTVKANGTATANCNFVLSNKARLDKFASGTYIMNGCPAGGADDGSTYFMGFYAPNKSAYDFGSGTNISLSGNEDQSANIYIRIANGYTANNLIFKPMIRLSTESDATFAPWENKCPISGRTEVAVVDEGKNLYNNEVGTSSDSGITYTKNADGTIKATGTASANSYYNMTNVVFPAGTYAFNGCPSGGADNKYKISLFNVTTQQTIGTGDIGSGNTFTANGTDEYRLFIRVNNGYAFPTGGLLFKPMVRLASITDDTYVPYAHSSATIQLGTTVYGADINWDTGVMTVLWAAETFDGSEDETWGISGNNKRVNSPLIGAVIEKPADNNTVGHIISDKFKALTANETYTGSQGAGISIDADYGLIGVNDGTGLMNVSAWKTYLASNPLQVCYKLATPTTIQLTPTQLEMLKGYNRVTIDNGSIELGYTANVQAEVDVLETTKADNADVVDYIENGNTASRAYTANQFMLWKGDLYKVTTSIASGATITAGTNVSKTTIGAVLTALLNA